MKKRSILMKAFLIAFISMFVAHPSLAQSPTIDDDNWTENTFDEAYNAPNSLIIKTWYESDGTGYVFNANKTFLMTFEASLSEYGLDYTIKVPGTWKRNKTGLSFTTNFAKAYVAYDKKEIARLPMRRQDLIKKELNKKVSELKNSGSLTDSYQILRLEEDIMVLGIPNNYYRGGYKPKVLEP